MNVTSAQVKKILTGSQTYTQLGFSMMITRLKGIYSKSPSPETLQKCTDEINTFLVKFASIMATDFAIVSKL